MFVVEETSEANEFREILSKAKKLHVMLSEAGSEAGKPHEAEESHQSEPDKEEVVDSSSLERYKHQCPPLVLPYIKRIFDPPSDGHCGFHAVSRALGYDNEGCYRVREEMIEEISKNKNTYTKLLGGANKLAKVVDGLKVGEKKGPVGPSKWLNQLSHGQILADLYVRPVVFISLKSSSSFIPLRLGPDQSPDTTPIYLLHVDNNHWTLAYIEPKDGVRPIPPPLSSKQLVSDAAKGWKYNILSGVLLYSKK
ncbi:hypothetical protein PTTG_29752 [Puccinia triticina 1-1 BBBD Race 1]|uniref:OTU domain-containing protein n=1 Tax=Puccinia triticina (isolate 1-1 / race 1 (BBBD)) TaxID=630390 RepID=A0A180G4G1_PUCT1|nr:hypothetical protein PTTG_29752 [Puccinia triticina 1-1 BBBD Race 1]